MIVLRFARITRLVLADLHFSRRTHFRYSIRYLVLSCPHNTTYIVLLLLHTRIHRTCFVAWLYFGAFFWNRTAVCFIFNVNACGNSNEMKLKLKPKFKQASICIHQLSVCCNAYTRFFLSKISNACWTIHHTNVGESIKLVLFKLNQAVNNVSSFPWTNQVIFNFTWLPESKRIHQVK